MRQQSYERGEENCRQTDGFSSLFSRLPLLTSYLDLNKLLIHRNL